MWTLSLCSRQHSPLNLHLDYFPASPGSFLLPLDLTNSNDPASACCDGYFKSILRTLLIPSSSVATQNSVNRRNADTNHKYHDCLSAMYQVYEIDSLTLTHHRSYSRVWQFVPSRVGKYHLLYPRSTAAALVLSLVVALPRPLACPSPRNRSLTSLASLCVAYAAPAGTLLGSFALRGRLQPFYSYRSPTACHTWRLTAP